MDINLMAANRNIVFDNTSKHQIALKHFDIIVSVLPYRKRVPNQRSYEAMTSNMTVHSPTCPLYIAHAKKINNSPKTKCMQLMLPSIPYLAFPIAKSGFVCNIFSLVFQAEHYHHLGMWTRSCKGTHQHDQ
jgi:hypothetical protein